MQRCKQHTYKDNIKFSVILLFLTFQLQHVLMKIWKTKNQQSTGITLLTYWHRKLGKPGKLHYHDMNLFNWNLYTFLQVKKHCTYSNRTRNTTVRGSRVVLIAIILQQVQNMNFSKEASEDTSNKMLIKHGKIQELLLVCMQVLTWTSFCTVF